MTKHAHWNVKGPSFIALHELFDQVAEHVDKDLWFLEAHLHAKR
jgi:DNA-binding ferritin-like protein